MTRPNLLFQQNILAIDLGNTSVSFGFFTPNSIEASFQIKIKSGLIASFPNETTQDLVSFFNSVRQFIQSTNTDFHIWISSVVPHLNKKLEEILSHFLFFSILPKTYHYLDSSCPLPIKNLYKTPQTLGSDRLAFASYASIQFEEENVICIDVGTAITYDIVSHNKAYLGGLILPGIYSIKSALLSNTAQLPNFDFKKPDSLIGSSTISCLESGLFFGLKAQTEGLIEMINSELILRTGSPSSQVIITGGDAEHFKPFIKGCIEVKDGVLMGLRVIGEWTKT